MGIINQLKNLDFSYATPDIIREILSPCPLFGIEFLILPNCYILRARKGSNFTLKSEMTYPPINSCNTLKRASLPGYTMFYGVISDDQSHQENARAICTLECSNLCKAGITSIGKEEFGLSYWLVKKPLRICSFITDLTYSHVKNNALLTTMRASFIRTHQNYNSSVQAKELARFISNEFSKNVNNPSEYLLTATISTDMIYTMGYDGIVYPSVRLGGQAGLNIALSPEVVDSKLSFIRIISQTLYKNGLHSFARIESVCENGRIRNLNQISDKDLAHILSISDISLLPKY